MSGQEGSTRIVIDAGDDIRALAFTQASNGEYLVSGQGNGVRVWQGKHCVATMKAKNVQCVAVSKDGEWIAAGTSWGEVFVWEARTCEQAFVLKHYNNILGVDFSPDSTRLVVASSNGTATVWDINTGSGKPMQTLNHDDWVIAAKYSALGERIATATIDHVQVWDSNDGNLLVDIPVEVVPYFNNGLLWSDDHLFVVSKRSIKELDASVGSTVSEWQVPEAGVHSCIALPKHGRLIAYATKRTVTLCVVSTRSTIGEIQYSDQIYSVAVSPGDCRIAIVGEDGKVANESLSCIINSIPFSRLHPTLQEPTIQIGSTALDAWQRGQLDSAEALLGDMIAASSIQNHHVLAGRALVRARLTRWDDALADAEKAISIQPSIIGYIAESIALLGNGDRNKAYRLCDIAIERFHSNHVTFALLVKSIIVFMAGERLDAISRLDDLITLYPYISIFYVVQARGGLLAPMFPLMVQQAHMLSLHGNSLMGCSNYEDAIQSFERARIRLRPYQSQSLFLISLISGWKFDDLDVTIRRCMCEALHAAGREASAHQSLLELVYDFKKQVPTSEAIAWVSDFAHRCLATQRNAICNADMSMHYLPLLRVWAEATLASCSWKSALTGAVSFVVQRFAVYQAVCERLEAIGHMTDATECVLKMENEIPLQSDEEARWIADFKRQVSSKLEGCGNSLMNARRHAEAIVQYSSALSLGCKPLQYLLAKRSRARANMGLWKDAIDDANQVILLDPSSPFGYERKYAASRGMGDHSDVEVAFKMMLSKMSESPDPATRERSRLYIKPTETECAIREAIQTAIHESPPALINAHTGRLLDKQGQASSFESQPIFHELVSSTTTQIDHPRIHDEVRHYYRYATFSHKWKQREPSFDDVIHLVVYALEQSPTHDKLQKFCEIVREAGLHWAWSDTCCINKSDPSVLQEALVSMFQWYQSSTLTVVLLCDVPLQRLFDSVWNSRAWTFQEYHASKVVRFYNKDWTLYKNLDIPNHKESPEIVAEMEEATGISTRALMALRPGLEDIREKLRLASSRQSTRIEDTAYSLLGIFSLSMPIEYGEGDRALGRLLAQLLASSGDTSILAWTGKSGGFNSCLPAKIAVFSQSPTLYIPPAMTSADMETAITRLRGGPLDLNSLMKLCTRLTDLPVPLLSGKRVRLPSIVFKLGQLSASRNGVFRARTSALGIVEIETSEDLSRCNSLVLVHPWIDFLLGRQPVGGTVGGIPQQQSPSCVIETIPEETGTEEHLFSTGEPPTLASSGTVSVDLKRRISPRFPHLRLFSRQSTIPDALYPGRPPSPAAFSRRPTSDSTSLLPPSTMSETDRQMEAVRVLARLKQPFGALLLAPDSRNVSAYKRVAAGSLITAQLGEITPGVLDKLIRSVDVLDVL